MPVSNLHRMRPLAARTWIPPVRLARHDTTTSTFSANAVARSESMLCGGPRQRRYGRLPRQ